MVSLAQIVANAMPPLPMAGVVLVQGSCHLPPDEVSLDVDSTQYDRPDGMSDREWMRCVLSSASAPMSSVDLAKFGLDRATASSLLSWAQSEKMVECVGWHRPLGFGARKLKLYRVKR